MHPSMQITHIYQMDRMGYNLVVHPFGFVVHRPHSPSAGYNKTFTGPAYTRGHKPTEVRWSVFWGCRAVGRQQERPAGMQ